MSEETTETWNMAMAYFQSINDLMNNAIYNQIKNRPIEWFKSLVGLYTTIYAKLTNSQKEVAQKLLENARKDINNAQRTVKGAINTASIMELHLYLLQQLENRGMLTPKSDDATKAYING